MHIIDTAINDIKEQFLRLNQKQLSDEHALSYVAIRYFYSSTKGFNVQDTMEMITDGSRDGGIDFVYYDEDQNKVILGQSKYTTQIDNNSIIEEFNKMSATVGAFLTGNTGAYNSMLKRELQNALDRLPEEDTGNVELVLFTPSTVNVDNLFSMINRGDYTYSVDMVTVYPGFDIAEKVQSAWEELDTVAEAEIEIDRKDNYLEYSSDSTEGILVNIKASSLKALYNSYVDKGLFDLNIRRYIRNKLVDSGIKETLDKDRENFWFFNNGIIIACNDYRPDGYKIRLYDFSIVNGGQTTTLIGNYSGSNNQDFFIPCKIISSKKKGSAEFYNKIAEATNSQKPILPRDLRSNSPEMRRLKGWLENHHNVYLEIKRGEKKPSKNFKYNIKNDELGQLILSLAHQQPGTSRSGKKAIFENSSIYNKIFKNNYVNDEAKCAFIIDLIDLNDRYSTIEERVKKKLVAPVDKDVIRNGKQVIFALLGILYSLANEDLRDVDIVNDPNIARDHTFVFASIIGNYKDDDLDNLLEKIVNLLVTILGECYEKSLDSGESSSISNYFKTDKKYIDKVLADFMKYYTRYSAGEELRKHSIIFKRP